MKFGETLASNALPEWRQFYVDYSGLKQRLQQAKAAGADAVDIANASPATTSLSILRSLSISAAAAAGDDDDHHDDAGARGATAAGAQQQQQQRAAAAVAGSGSSSIGRLRGRPFVALGLTPESGPEELFLQELQQELSKVHNFVAAEAARVSAALDALAASAPQLAARDPGALEARAGRLGRGLLALEGFVQLNQMGFVKIVKKHDKLMPRSPIWHLYLHHLQRAPWLDEQQRQFMWAALSSCYYHMHAHGRAPAGRPPAAAAAAGASGSQQGRTGGRASPAAAASNGGRAVPPAAAAGGSGSSGSVLGLGGLLPALGSAVAGAASAVAGAATAMAGAAAAAAAVPAAVTAAAAAQLQGTATAAAAVGEQLSFTGKFWVSPDDVPAVMYLILQHLPLLPSAAHATEDSRAAAKSPAFGITSRPVTPEQPAARQQELAQQPPQQQQQQQQQPGRRRRSHELAGFTTLLHTVFFDNPALELYHGRLYLRPLACTLKARWVAHADGAVAGELVDGWAPARVVLERKVYKEGWKGEPNQKDSLLIAGDKLPAYLAGSYTLGDALAQLCQLPDLQQQLQAALAPQPAAGAASRMQQQQQQVSPFAVAAGSGWAGAATGEAPARRSSSGSLSDADSHSAAAMAAAAAGIRVPPGVAIGAGSGRWSCQDLLQLEQQAQEQQEEQQAQQQQQQGEQQGQQQGRQQQQQQQQQGGPEPPWFEFEDAYLQPPLPSSDQLSLFSEVQRLVERKGLQPVLHCVVQRMLFAVPFDDAIRITLDTDVALTAVNVAGGALADVHAQRAFSAASFGSFSGPPAAARSSSTAGSWHEHSMAGRAASSSGGGGGGDSSALPLLGQHGDAEDDAFDTWAALYGDSLQHAQQQQPGHRHSSGSGGQHQQQVVHGLPYALVKVSLRLPAGQAPPAWLQALMDSELLTPVEQWSKFVHGCAVLLPDTVRAVPYWIDDPLVELSLQGVRAELEAQALQREAAEVARALASRQQGRAQQVAAAAGGRASVSRGQGSAPLLVPSGSLASRLASSVGSLLPGSLPAGGGASSWRAGSSSGGGGIEAASPRTPRSSGGLRWAAGAADALPPPHHLQSDSPAASSPRRASRLHVGSSGGGGCGGTSNARRQLLPQAGALAAAAAAAAGDQQPERHVHWLPDASADDAAADDASSEGEQGQPAAAASTAPRGRLLGLLHRHREKLPPLFRPQAASRKRWGHPVQLLECREFFYSEAILLEWLRLAVTMASVAVLLLGYSAIAYVNPLKRPTLHVAEIISLLLLPGSCVIVGYAIRVFVWRGKRLHSMRYRRVDDQAGPLLMALMFVVCMAAIMLVNVADLVLLLKYAAKHHGGDGDDPGGGQGPW